MKTRIILYAFLCLISFSTCLAQNNRIISDEEVLDTAKANLNKFVELIDGMYKEYGFNSKESMNSIQLGAPYEVIFLSSDFVTDSVFVEGKNYFSYENYQWRVPLIVNDTMRCFLHVIYSNDTLKFSGGGGTQTMQLLDKCEKKYSIPKEGKRYLLLPEVIYMCEFIMLSDSDNSFILYPVRKNIEGYNDCTYDASYNKHSSIKDFFNTYKTKIYSSSINEINSSYQFEIYPNPLNKNGILRGVIPQSTQKADIKIFDNRGKALFQNRIKDRGAIKLDISKSIFPTSGIYFYKIVLDRITITKKIVVTN